MSKKYQSEPTWNLHEERNAAWEVMDGHLDKASVSIFDDIEPLLKKAYDAGFKNGLEAGME